MIRKFDSAGRICIPKEMRDALYISDKDYVNITMENDKIILKKHEIQNEDIKEYLEGEVVRLQKQIEALNDNK